MTSAREDRHGPDEGPGGRLRQERLERGLSSQQVAEQLNLDVVVIQAIEDNDFPALGAPVFARGHLRRYASLLGIAEGDVLAQYDRSQQPEAPTLVPRAHFDRLPERHAPRWPLVVGGIVVLLAGGGLIALLGSGSRQWPWHKSPAPEPQVGANSSAGPQLTTRSSAGSTAVEAGSGAATTSVPATDSTAVAPASKPAAAAGGATTGSLRLDFRFAQDSWIEIFDGTGKAILYDLGAAGTTRTVTAVPPLSVTVGNAPAVALSVNGQAAALPKPEPGQTVVRVRVERTGVVR